MTKHSKVVMMTMTSAVQLKQCRKYTQKCHFSLFWSKSKYGILGDNLLPWIFDIDINGKQDTKAHHGELWSRTWSIKTIGWIGDFGLLKGDLTFHSQTLVKDQRGFMKFGLTKISNIWVGYFDQSNETNVDRTMWLFRDMWKPVEDNACMEVKRGTMCLVGHCG